MSQLIRLAAVVVAIQILAGCQSSSYLYVQETVAGVDLGVSASGNNKLTVGYSTDTFAVVPQKGDGGESASSIAIIDGAIKGIKCFNYEQFNATGTAAKQLASQGQVLTKIREKIYDKPGENQQNCQ